MTHEPVGEVMGSDVVEFTTNGEKVYLHCLLCGEDLPLDVVYLNQAILVWNRHVAEMRPGASATPLEELYE